MPEPPFFGLHGHRSAKLLPTESVPMVGHAYGELGPIVGIAGFCSSVTRSSVLTAAVLMWPGTMG